MIHLPLDLIFTTFNYLGYNEAHILKNISSKYKDLVKLHRWNDLKTDLKTDIKNIKKWRENFPNAIGVSIDHKVKLKDKDFKYFIGIKHLKINSQKNITDRAFKNLEGIHSLDMSWCNQKKITDRAFKNLRGIHTLIMNKCYQTTITDRAFKIYEAFIL
jgi:hypothetical protein